MSTAGRWMVQEYHADGCEFDRDNGKITEICVVAATHRHGMMEYPPPRKCGCCECDHLVYYERSTPPTYDELADLVRQVGQGYVGPGINNKARELRERLDG